MHKVRLSLAKERYHIKITIIPILRRERFATGEGPQECDLMFNIRKKKE